MKRVLVYREAILPMSETFIKQQILSMTAWAPVLFGGIKVERGLDLNDIKHVAVFDRGPSFLQQVGRLACRYLGVVNPSYLKAARALKPDLIHVHFGTDALMAYPLAKALRVPLVITLHGYDAHCYPSSFERGDYGHFYRRYPTRIKKIAQDPSVRFVAVASAVKKSAVSQLGVPAEKIEVIHLGVDCSKFSPGPTPITARDNNILFVGRMVEKKAPEVLIRAAASVTGVPGLRLTFIGDGPLQQRAMDLAQELKVDARFLGAQPAAVVREEFGKAKLFCLPSITAENGDAEGLPIVVLESQACGVPVLTSARGGRDEGIAPASTGFAFEEGDCAELARLISCLLTETQVLDQAAKDGPHFVANKHNSTNCVVKLEKFYDDLVSK
jgi:colanic acid/amylovoran biosynthesis glycosyltransferase